MDDTSCSWEGLSARYTEWLSNVRNMSPHTLRAYTTDINAFYDWCSANELDPLRSSKRRLKGYVSHIVRSGYADKTINRKLSSLRTFYDWLEREGAVEASPFSALPGRKQKKSLPRTILHSDVVKLIDSCDTSTPVGMRDAAFLELLYASGARISEIADLAVSALDFGQGQLRLYGKRRKERIVPLYNRALEKLQAYLRDARPALLDRSSEEPVPDALFVSSRGKAMSADSLRVVFKERAESVGLDACIGPHAVRHTYATELLNGGADLKTVQELLGHENLSTTQIYTHLSVDRLKSSMRLAHPRSGHTE